MPEVYFRVQWPSGEVTRCYSPSTVVLEYFQEGLELTIKELSRLSREAFEQASRRVEVRYGYRCSSATAERDKILELSGRFEEQEVVRILSTEAAEQTIKDRISPRGVSTKKPGPHGACE